MEKEFLISTTPAIEKRRKALEAIGIHSDKFCPTAIDYYKNFDSFSEKKKNITDPIRGYNRLLKTSFQKSQIKKINEKLKQNNYHRQRLLTTIPENYPVPNMIRKVWLEILDKGGSPQLDIPTNNKDTLQSLKDFVEKLEYKKPMNLVLRDDMPLKEIKAIIPWAAERFGEIIIMYSNWNKWKENYSEFLLFARQYPNLLHLHGTFWNLTKYQKEEILGILAICSGFKSVSFKEPPFPGFILKHKSVREKPPLKIEEKMQRSVWINDYDLTYREDHVSCECFGENSNDLSDLIHRSKLIDCQTHHLLETFSTVMTDIIENEKERTRIMKLESMKPLVSSLLV